MAYGFAAVDQLGSLVSRLPDGGGILELGSQDINADVPHSTIARCLAAIHGSKAASESAIKRLSADSPLKVGELFRNSRYKYRCIDLYPGEFTIVADLNTCRVAKIDLGTFRLITNYGMTEHVADQINSFRTIHDYAAVGATFVHSVPFSGYFNHGLYNYHPLFFIFLAQANNYKIESFGLSRPHLPYTIPTIDVLNSASWADSTIQSGMVTCQPPEK